MKNILQFCDKISRNLVEYIPSLVDKYKDVSRKYTKSSVRNIRSLIGKYKEFSWKIEGV